VSAATPGALDEADLEHLAAAGIDRAEAARQLALLASPPPPARLARPCTVGDGILRLDEARLEQLEARGRAARDDGRLMKFVPASGAATRMFRALAAVRERLPEASADEIETAAAAGDADARAALDFVAALPRLALARQLAERLGLAVDGLEARARSAPLGPLLGELLDPAGLGAGEAPKALLAFHLAAEGPRTAFVEHLIEGLGYLADRDGTARYHFTIPPGGRERFERELAAGRSAAGAHSRLNVAFSEQSRATDTLALELDGRPARDATGRLLLRPAGHGALLGNLESTAGDLVAIKNIDNVLPAPRHAEIARWQRVLAGLADELWREGRGDERPLRVAGVVANAGEPGGGPFWVAAAGGGESRQIVESSQVDRRDPAQRSIWGSSTHFNPVNLVVALRDRAGRAHELERFVDPSTSFVTTKSEGGRELRVLERPGLWNGAMARWATVFVEVPAATFAPVKTVLDLARDAHAVPR
jgi:hypothetical protein